MEKGNNKKSTWKLGILIVAIIIIVIAGICFWYFQVKKPHDKAIMEFNAAAAQVEEKNAELDDAINSAQTILDAGEPAYDELTINDVTVAISDATLEKEKFQNCQTKQTISNLLQKNYLNLWIIHPTLLILQKRKLH